MTARQRAELAGAADAFGKLSAASDAFEAACVAAMGAVRSVTIVVADTPPDGSFERSLVVEQLAEHDRVIGEAFLANRRMRRAMLPAPTDELSDEPPADD